MSLSLRLATYIIKKSFHLSVWTIEQFHNAAIYEQKANELKKLPEGTLGRDIAECLDKNGLRLVPKFESHDLKHVLLEFKMTPIDEIRMQAFMLGNGNYSIASFAIFAFGAFLLPDLWKTFYQDFIRGKASEPISGWTIEEFAEYRTTTLRETVFNAPVKSKSQNMKSFVKIGSIYAIVIGSLGMLFCLPFMFSSSLADLVGAGIPFLSAAIIASAGLLSFSRLTQTSSTAVQA